MRSTHHRRFVLFCIFCPFLFEWLNVVPRAFGAAFDCAACDCAAFAGAAFDCAAFAGADTFGCDACVGSVWSR